MSDILSDSGLPAVQRVVTGHNEDGRAIFKSEDISPTKMIPSGDASFLTIWTTETVPADNNDERDGRDLPTGLTLERGSVIRITDMLPGKESPMHRTNSIDYGIVLKGEIELELEDGRKRPSARAASSSSAAPTICGATPPTSPPASPSS
jgi:hypothetical protein